MLCVPPVYVQYLTMTDHSAGRNGGATLGTGLGLRHATARNCCHVDRQGLGVFNTANDARTYIASELDRLSAEMRRANLPASRLDQVLAFVQARKADILNGQTRCSYVAL